ncbi:MAG: tetratricopeptide repeat protein [Janthinobacterium lividum]
MPAPMQSSPRTSVINPEADRRLGRIALSFGVVVFGLLILTTFAIPYADMRYHLPIVPKAILNGASLLVVLIPFYFGIYRLFNARLEIGRERIQARAWTEAVAALEPFTAPMQRFLDHSGEAHYLLGQAYAGLGDKVRAEKARAFVRRKLGSPWAEKLLPSKGPSISRITAKNGANAEPGQEKRPTPTKSKPRRRF